MDPKSLTVWRILYFYSTRKGPTHVMLSYRHYLTRNPWEVKSKDECKSDHGSQLPRIEGCMLCSLILFGLRQVRSGFEKCKWFLGGQVPVVFCPLLALLGRLDFALFLFSAKLDLSTAKRVFYLFQWVILAKHFHPYLMRWWLLSYNQLDIGRVWRESTHQWCHQKAMMWYLWLMDPGLQKISLIFLELLEIYTQYAVEVEPRSYHSFHPRLVLWTSSYYYLPWQTN